MPGERSPIRVQRLENGVSYKFKVHAINGVGRGPAGLLSDAAVPEAEAKAPPPVVKRAAVLDEVTGELAEAVLPLLRVGIARAAGLAKADTFGQSDPYVVVRWSSTSSSPPSRPSSAVGQGGHRPPRAPAQGKGDTGDDVLGKTAVRKKTLCPEWGKGEVFDVRVGDRPPGGRSLAHDLVVDAESIARFRAMRGPSRGRSRGGRANPPSSGAHVAAADVVLPGQTEATLAALGWLTLEVFDWNRVGTHDFLGQLRVCGRELYAMSKGAGVRPDGTITLPLERKPPAELEERKQKLVQGELTFTLEALGDWPQEAEVHLE